MPKTLSRDVAPRVTSAGATSPAIDTTSSSSTTSTAPTVPATDSSQPTSEDASPTTVDSGANCSADALTTLAGHGVKELDFAGATWDAGNGVATSIAVLALPAGAPLPVAWVEEFYEAGARSGKNGVKLTLRG